MFGVQGLTRHFHDTYSSNTNMLSYVSQPEHRAQRHAPPRPLPPPATSMEALLSNRCTRPRHEYEWVAALDVAAANIFASVINHPPPHPHPHQKPFQLNALVSP